MNPTAIYSKSGKGVQEATGKTGLLSRADRSVLGGFDGKLTVVEVAERVGKPFDAKFEALVEQLDKDGFIRQVSPGTPIAPVPPVRPAAGKPAKPSSALGEDLDFTVFSSPKPKPAAPAAPPVDLAAKARADSERRAKEEDATSYKGRQEADARAKAEAEARAKAAAAGRAQAEAAARAKAESEARARAEAEAKAKAAEAERALADADAKIKAAQEAAQRIAKEAKAKAEADAAAKVQAELAKAREEAERKARVETERMRNEAERIRKEAEDKARREAEERSRREQEELRRKLEEERKAREEAERKAKEAEERRRKEDEERRAREEAERKAKEEAERKAREEAERRAREEAELRAREEAARKAREAEERRRKEEEERRRREEEERRAKEEAERRAREEAERKARAEAEERRRREEDARRAREEEERREREAKERREREAKERREREEREEREQRERLEAERKAKEEEAAPPAKGGDFADSLLADLDSFDKREADERKAKEEAESKRKAEKERKAKEEAERRARDESERRAKEERERRQKEEAERQEREEAEREAREAEERERREADERKRRAKESLAARATESAADKAAAADDDIGITDEDLDLDEVKRDEAALSKQARRAAREREREREEARTARPASDAPPAKFRRPMKWGKPVAIGLFLLLVAGIGAIHVMPISTAEYESAASEALGTPVKIGSARLSLLTGAELKMSNVTAGQAKIAVVRAYPEIGSLFNPKKAFSRIELEDAAVPQEALGAVLYGKARSANFEVRRVTARKLKLMGPVVLPPLDADLQLGSEGEARSLTLKGPDSLLARIAPAGSGGELEFELNANSFTLPIAPDIVLNGFGMKGTANKQGMDVASWTASLYDGVISGNARVAWRDEWSVDGVVTARGVNAAVFAPALLSEGKADGTGKFSMSGVDPGKLAAGGRLEGSFTINKGALGSIDVARALSTGGRQASGRTPFSELTGQGVYDKGAVSLRNITLTAGALNAGASADIAASGTLSGRIVADVKSASQTLRATLSVGGTVKEPQVRN